MRSGKHSIGEIEECLSIAAEVVDRYGDIYLPYFVLMEEELEAARARLDVRQRVREVLAGRKAKAGLARLEG